MLTILHLITGLEAGGAERMLVRLATATDRGRFRPVVVSMTDQAGRTTQYTYDNANQLRSIIELASPASQNTTSYDYDINGNRITSTDKNAHSTQSAFDFFFNAKGLEQRHRFLIEDEVCRQTG